MKDHPHAVSIRPYFTINPAQREVVHTMLRRFIEKTASEPKCLFYDFTLNGDELSCQEAYADAEGVLAHLDNVGETLQQLMQYVTMQRLEIHGPAAELDKLQAPLAAMKPMWFIRQCGLE